MKIQNESRQFEAQFEEKTEELLFLTGPNGFGGGRVPGEKLWSASIGLAAYKRPGEEAVRQDGTLTLKADDDLLHRLQAQVKPYSVIRAAVRAGRERQARFMLVGETSPARDGELEAILEELKKPVYLEDEVLGRFTLDRQVNWFEADVDWLGQTVRLSFDWDEDEAMEDSLRTAKALMADQEEWNRRVLARASEDLLELKNDSWLEEDEEELDAEKFEARLELESIEVRPEGEFCFWFEDGDLFWGHSITVEGTLEGGPEQADIQG